MKSMKEKMTGTIITFLKKHNMELTPQQKDSIRQRMRLEIATEDDIINYYKN